MRGCILQRCKDSLQLSHLAALQKFCSSTIFLLQFCAAANLCSAERWLNFSNSLQRRNMQPYNRFFLIFFQFSILQPGEGYCQYLKSIELFFRKNEIYFSIYNYSIHQRKAQQYTFVAAIKKNQYKTCFHNRK